MTEAFDPLGPNWGDVVHRSRRALRRRRALNAAALFAVVAAGVASAYALGHPVIDFGKAQHGSLKQVNQFGSMEVGAPRGMAPGVLPHQTRRITAVRIDRHWHTLYVAPTTRGGFCYLWTTLIGSCRATRTGIFAARLDTGGEVGPQGALILSGSFIRTGGERLTMTFEDGSTVDVPFVWVTAPIDAGFYLYRIPDAHRHLATRAVSLALFDKHGKLITREPMLGPEPLPGGQVHRVKGFPPLDIPLQAIWAKRTLLFDQRGDDNARVGLWVAPERGGGRCYWSNNASRCTRGNGGPSATEIRTLGFSGGGHVTLCCELGSRIARVEARFQGGVRVELTPQQGLLLWVIPSRYYALGHRIVSVVGYDASDRAIARHVFPKPADQAGVYPCKKPKSLGYGVKRCA